MPRESKLAFKVGLFVLIAFLGLTFFVFSVSDTTVFEGGQLIKVVFEFANGLKKNAPVRIAGVDEGIVKEIKLFFDDADGKTKVDISLWIKKGSMIPGDSIVLINQLGLMGEKYIEILPGKDRVNFLKEGQVLKGKDPISQEAMSERVMKVADKLEHTADGVNKLIQNETNLESVELALKSLSSITLSLDEIIADVKGGSGTVGRLLYDDDIYENLESLSADLKANPWKLLHRPKRKKIKE
ncbi:MAG: MCE family protein [Candidatus Omnitrophica bacterium]|nr:MCE family protein [Candidatus Omnitrophota bacterium]MBU1997794.1 MCE family protein [Candidatus Omnitrophota bacterium]